MSKPDNTFYHNGILIEVHPGIDTTTGQPSIPNYWWLFEARDSHIERIWAAVQRPTWQDAIRHLCNHGDPRWSSQSVVFKDLPDHNLEIAIIKFLARNQEETQAKSTEAEHRNGEVVIHRKEDRITGFVVNLL